MSQQMIMSFVVTHILLIPQRFVLCGLSFRSGIAVRIDDFEPLKFVQGIRIIFEDSEVL
jgi:hypothetical protein